MAVTNRLSAIAAEMGQLKNEIQERRRALNLFLRNVRARNSAEADERIGAARDKGFRGEAASAAGGAASTIVYLSKPLLRIRCCKTFPFSLLGRCRLCI